MLMKKCPYCGKRYADDLTVCALDAAALEPEQPLAVASAQNAANIWSGRWLPICLSVAVVLNSAFGFLFYQYSNDVQMVILEDRVYNVFTLKLSGQCIRYSKETVDQIIKSNPKEPIALFAAVGRNDVALTQQLLHQGANPNRRTGFGHYPIHEAVSHGNRTNLDLLLAAGADVNVRVSPKGFLSPNQWTPLHFAADRGDTYIVATLLSKGAKVNMRDHWGHTPLYYARQKGHNEIIELLMKRGGAE
jgi:hypothetical protein